MVLWDWVYAHNYTAVCYTLLCCVSLVLFNHICFFLFYDDYFLQTVEEIEGVLGRDLYPNLSEERSRWEKELAGLREENESLTAMLCSKEEELNRTKATMNAIREERDRLRRRVRLYECLNAAQMITSYRGKLVCAMSSSEQVSLPSCFLY